jgi:glycosyltransferase involved in cell wall biosynthesis
VAYAPHDVDDAFQEFVAARRDEIRFVPLKVGREISPAQDLPAVMQLRRLVRDAGPFDILHGHSAKGGAIARIAGYRTGVPALYTPHALIMSSPEISGRKAALYTAIERVLGRLATAKIIAVSEDERRFILGLGLTSPDRVALVENGIEDEDFEYFSSAPGSAAAISTDAPLTFGTTMRLSAQKAPQHLITAFRRVTEELPALPMRLVIAGDGELSAEVERQVQEEGLGGKVSLLGWQADVRKTLTDFDVFVVSSLYEAGLSYSTMEAMAARLPIVSTDVFGANSTLSRLPGNVVVPKGDPEALAQGMRAMATLDEPVSLRRSLRRIGQRNREHVRINFDQRELAMRTLEIYRAVRRRG